MEEKRKFPRLADNCLLKYQIVDHDSFRKNQLDAEIVNLSGGGIQFTTRWQLPPKTLLAIEMQAPAFDMPVVAIANTIWCAKRSNDDAFDVGCEFWWLGWKDNEIQKSLADYIINKIANP